MPCTLNVTIIACGVALSHDISCLYTRGFNVAQMEKSVLLHISSTKAIIIIKSNDLFLQLCQCVICFVVKDEIRWLFYGGGICLLKDKKGGGEKYIVEDFHIISSEPQTTGGSVPAAENFPSTGLAAHSPLGLSGRTSLPRGASWVACIQRLPCTASSWNMK